MPRKARSKPAHYRPLPFHVLRSAQLVSAAVVASIMVYFLSELSRDHYRLPWTFLLLLAVSVLTVLSLSGTIVLHCFYGLNPRLNMVLNSLLLLLWSVAFALLSWWSAGTLRHVCNKDNWDTTTGITVCREYKALFSFSLFGFVSTLLALVLDVHTMRGATRRGKFTQLRMEVKRGLEDEHMPELARGGEEFNPNPKAGRKQRPRGGDGYGVLEAEYVYDDTVYHGAGGQVGRRSLEERV